MRSFAHRCPRTAAIGTRSPRRRAGGVATRPRSNGTRVWRLSRSTTSPTGSPSSGEAGARFVHGRLDLPNRFVRLDSNPRTPCGGYVGSVDAPRQRRPRDHCLDPRTEPDWLSRPGEVPGGGSTARPSAARAGSCRQARPPACSSGSSPARSCPATATARFSRLRSTLIEWNGRSIESASEASASMSTSTGSLGTNSVQNGSSATIRMPPSGGASTTKRPPRPRPGRPGRQDRATWISAAAAIVLDAQADGAVLRGERHQNVLASACLATLVRLPSRRTPVPRRSRTAHSAPIGGALSPGARGQRAARAPARVRHPRSRRVHAPGCRVPVARAPAARLRGRVLR